MRCRPRHRRKVFAVEPSSDVCYLYESSGKLLTTGIWLFDAGSRMHEVLVTELDHPGLLVQRCLLRESGRVWLQLRDGALLPARIERIFFDRQHGRTCRLHLEDAALLAASQHESLDPAPV